MSRLLYTLCFYLAQPLVWLRLLWRARKQPEYLQHLGERYGIYGGREKGEGGRENPGVAETPCTTTGLAPIWIHLVSVGETRAAEPLLKALLAEYPDCPLLMTHMTPTGREVGRELIARYGPRLRQAYLPYDLPDACQRFFAHFQPRIGLLMETELWPNLIAAATRRGVPVALVNARLSERSLRGYRRFLPLIRPAVAALSAIAAQTPADAARLVQIGARAPRVVGNLKFDVTPPPEKLERGNLWRQALGSRPVWLAASTREGEEALILDALAGLNRPDILLLLVPRHPQRFAEAAALAEVRQLRLRRRSEGLPEAQTQVWLGDSMGEMPAYFAVADLALMGGTLLPFGGQNLIEAAACGCPVLLGPHTYNFAQASEDALACGAALRIADAKAAANAFSRLLNDRPALAAMRQAALEFSQAHRGATARTLDCIRNIAS